MEEALKSRNYVLDDTIQIYHQRPMLDLMVDKQPVWIVILHSILYGSVVCNVGSGICAVDGEKVCACEKS